jgi:hypothetical protein
LGILDEAHPILRARFEAAAGSYAEKNRDRALRVRQSTRSLQDQMKAFLKGTSKLDPRKKPSMHLFSPSLAIDVWIYQVAPEHQPEGGWWQAKPGVPSKLILSPNSEFPSDDITSEYRRWGYEAQSYPDAYWLKDARIVWGGSWKQGHVLDRWKLPSFFDGPHLQLSDKCCVYETQRLLKNSGRDPGPLDGLWGPKTRGALASFCAWKNIEFHLVPGRKFPVMPDVWSALWEFNDAA